MLDKRKPYRFWFGLSALCCLAIVAVGARGRFSYYIHPRYHLFTLITCLFGGVILLVATMRYKYDGTSDITYTSMGELVLRFSRWLLGRGAWFIVIVAALLVWSPATPLLSSAADKKQKASSVLEEYIYEASWFSEPKTIYQLSTALSTSRGIDTHKGKTFTFVGFIRADTQRDPDVFRLSRFVMSCCAVDATPNSIDVKFADWGKNFTVDDWVTVTGTLSVEEQGSTKRPLLIDTKVEKAKQPDEPYDFIGV